MWLYIVISQEVEHTHTEDVLAGSIGFITIGDDAIIGVFRSPYHNPGSFSQARDRALMSINIASMWTKRAGSFWCQAYAAVV
jgi:hypothetical protein